MQRNDDATCWDGPGCQDVLLMRVCSFRDIAVCGRLHLPYWSVAHWLWWLDVGNLSHSCGWSSSPATLFSKERERAAGVQSVCFRRVAKKRPRRVPLESCPLQLTSLLYFQPACGHIPEIHNLQPSLSDHGRHSFCNCSPILLHFPPALLVARSHPTAALDRAVCRLNKLIVSRSSKTDTSSTVSRNRHASKRSKEEIGSWSRTEIGCSAYVLFSSPYSHARSN